MLFLQVLLLLLLGVQPGESPSFTDFYALITSALYIVGLYRIFIKSGLQGWWALIPCAREYMLARCADREPEGRVTSVTAFLATAFNLAGLLFTEVMVTSPHGETIALALMVLVLTVDIIHFVYSIRVYSGLCEVYGITKRLRWILLWFVADWIVSLLWGFSDKYQPLWKVEDIRREALARFTGHTVAGENDGLTVNLEERTVTEFFQKKYLLRDIHLYIQPGHMVMLLGGSGAGKTTFLNAVNGYEKAKAKVQLNGEDVYAQYGKMQYEVGFVPQQELMRAKDTVYRTLMDAALLRLPTDVPAADRRARVDEVMKLFGLESIKGNLVEKLSGGQKKRLSIAMEFISSPFLFILDEPDSGLDGVMARDLMQELRKIADQGKIVIVITHTPDRVIDLFDDVIVLAKDSHRTGRLAFFGPVEEARKFFGCEKMEQIVLSINQPDEGGEGRADEFIDRFAEVQHA